MGSLKDLSNIIAETSEFVRKSPLAVKDFNKDMPSNYASTLPTFDVEYSPCALISGQILALRGVGVPDSYFGKPRYLSSQLEAKDLSQLGEEALEIKSICQNDKSKNPTLSKTNLLSGAIKEDSSLSSSKMGDITLEHMIDAILESTLKEKKLPKYSKHSQSHHHQQQQQHQHQQQQQQQLSPTYTPGDDPASDLHEVWDSNELRYRQKEQKHMNRFSRKRLFNETQINNPQQTTFSPDIDTIKLKRQRVVRRKRKITQITDSIINSAHKLLGKSNPSTDTITITACVAPSCVTEVYDTEIVSNDDPPSKKSRNISSDSGHNSSNGEFDDGGDKSETIFDNKVLTKDVERQVCDSAKRQLTFPVI
uniref:Uncharacterized protein n=1 Tax=Glossina pallidipes TaxID=7398 RepID=A0A1A9ZEP3_GLOPL